MAGSRRKRYIVGCLALIVGAILAIVLTVALVRWLEGPGADIVGQLQPEPTATATRRAATPRAATPRPPTTRPGGATPVAIGKQAALFVEPQAGRVPVLDAIEGAQKSIWLVIYLLTDEEITNALIAARQRGIDVRVMIEPNPFGGGDNDRMPNRLRQAGVQVKDSNPVFRFTHQKTLIVDERAALIMNLNLTRSAFTSNREYAIIDVDSARVAEIVGVFDADWNRTATKITHPDLVWSPENSRAKLLALLRSAQRTLVIQTEVMSDAETIGALKELVRRGVAVRLIMSPPDEGGTTDRALADLLAAGVQVRLVTTPYQHAKMVLADGVRGWIGSENFSANSLDNNRELGILLSEETILAVLADTFEKDWQVGK